MCTLRATRINRWKPGWPPCARLDVNHEGSKNVIRAELKMLPCRESVGECALSFLVF